MKRYHKRWIQLSIIILVTTIYFQIYKIDLYRWACESEPNKAACFLLAKELERGGDDKNALWYLKKSCELNYERACNELKE